MPFRRFFERGAKPGGVAPPAETDAEQSAGDDGEQAGAEEAAEAESQPAEHDTYVDWAARAAAVLPTAASTGS